MSEQPSAQSPVSPPDSGKKLPRNSFFERVSEDATKALAPYGVDFVGISISLIVALYELCIFLALAEGVSYVLLPIGPVLSILLYLLLWIFSSLAIWGIFNKEIVHTSSEKPTGAEQAEVKTAFSIAIILIYGLGTFVVFSQLMRHLFLLFGGFDAHKQTSYWLWLRFGFDQFFDHVLFGIRSIFGWRISPIEPTTIWSRALVLTFNVELDALVIVAGVRALRLARTDWHSSGALPHKNYLSYVPLLLRNVLLFCLLALPLIIGLQATIHNQLSLVSAWTMVKRGVPIAFGGGLAWYSLHAFKLPGWWSKLCALGGAVVGVGLIWIFWRSLFSSLL